MSIAGEFKNVVSISGEVIISRSSGGGTPYDGAYNFTPSNEAQTIEIQGKYATQNITIDPIPENYGRITWNGSTLTVS